jgi:septal ring factor EnvC (AmiA/AmiB activator)
MATKPSTYLVVLLTDLMAHGDQIPDGTILEVDRAVRNDWVGSKLCRDATDEEIAEYRGQESAADCLDEQMQADQAQLIAEIERLQERKAELAGDLAALESDIEEFGKKRDALADEVAALEKAKKAVGK